MKDIDPQDDYLWDGRGTPAPDVAELEKQLRPHGWRSDTRPTLHAQPALAPPQPMPNRRRWTRIALAAAASVAVLLFGGRAALQYRLQWPQAQPWQMAVVTGSARIDGEDAAALRALAPGRLLETGHGGAVRLKAARIGEVIVGEQSRFTLEETGDGRHRTRLQQGRLWARIWAPPGAFGVATPAGEFFDLGCEFLLYAEADGSGSLSVASGWVQIDTAWREVLVPQGTRVEFGAQGRPGTPYASDADPQFVQALRRIDGGAGPPQPADVRLLAEHARTQDAITLLTLLQQYPALADGPVFDRLGRIMPADARVTRAGARSGDWRALSPWWDALPYPRIKQWWLQWPDGLRARADAAVLLQEPKPPQ